MSEDSNYDYEGDTLSTMAVCDEREYRDVKVVNKLSNLIPERDSDRVTQMAKVQKEALELFRRKNKDYGDSFATYGSVGVIVRMGDKIQRLLSVSNNGVALVDNESLRDTLIDLHNYAAMGVMLLDENTPFTPFTPFTPLKKV
jgi:hypothetical protein